MVREETIRQARALIREAVAASLATSRQGHPFVTLVTPAFAPDLSPLLWLSRLAAHSRHLEEEPRCALLVAGAPPEINPQTAPRLTLIGRAERVTEGKERARLKARWLARHPYAALYADFADFALWRITIEEALFVGGFARAERLSAAALQPEAAAVAAIAAAEEDIIAHVNADHGEAVTAIARGLLQAESAGPWRLVAVDVDGCDLSDGQRTLRFTFTEPAGHAEAVRAELVRAARAGRARLAADGSPPHS